MDIGSAAAAITHNPDPQSVVSRSLTLTGERGQVEAVNLARHKGGGGWGQRQSIALGGQSIGSAAAAITHNPDPPLVSRSLTLAQGGYDLMLYIE